MGCVIPLNSNSSQKAGSTASRPRQINKSQISPILSNSLNCDSLPVLSALAQDLTKAGHAKPSIKNTKYIPIGIASMMRRTEILICLKPGFLKESSSFKRVLLMVRSKSDGKSIKPRKERKLYKRAIFVYEYPILPCTALRNVANPRWQYLLITMPMAEENVSIDIINTRSKSPIPL